QINPDLKIEIAGHINQPLIAPDRLPAWEQRLSERRAEMVFNYLIQNGIGPERLSWKGYGNREMLFPKPKSEAEHAQNRRVEIRVLARN
ncbi:MAG: OmpA family protein, partial [Saprospiraceae bacterium]